MPFYSFRFTIHAPIHTVCLTLCSMPNVTSFCKNKLCSLDTHNHICMSTGSPTGVYSIYQPSQPQRKLILPSPEIKSLQFSSWLQSLMNAPSPNSLQAHTSFIMEYYLDLIQDWCRQTQLLLVHECKGLVDSI